MKKYILILFLIFILKSNFIYALSTINGSYGLITMPTAETIKYKQIDLAFDYLISNNGVASSNHYYYKAIELFQYHYVLYQTIPKPAS